MRDLLENESDSGGDGDTGGESNTTLIFKIFKEKLWVLITADEMAQMGRTPAIKPDNLSLIPKTQMVKGETQF